MTRPSPDRPDNPPPERGDWTILAQDLPVNPRHMITAPIIYALIVPFILLDLCVTLYQTLCFPIYGIPRVRRRDYLTIDRYRLEYLNWIQKLNCTYCGYINGLIAYIAEVAGRTEAFWCPIKHAARAAASHRHYNEFMDYGDGASFDENLEIARRRIQSVQSSRSAPPQPDDDVDLG
jgi:hypothetical protein